MEDDHTRYISYVDEIREEYSLATATIPGCILQQEVLVYAASCTEPLTASLWFSNANIGNALVILYDKLNL